MPQRNALAPANYDGQDRNRMANGARSKAVDLMDYIYKTRGIDLSAIQDPFLQQAVAMRMLNEAQGNEPTITPELELFGSSGGFMPPDRLEETYVDPEMLYGRLGARGRVGPGELSGGASGLLMRSPSGPVRHYPGAFDVGYAVPLGGGQLRLGASTPIEPVGASRPVNVNASYTKRF